MVCLVGFYSLEVDGLVGSFSSLLIVVSNMYVHVSVCTFSQTVRI